MGAAGVLDTSTKYPVNSNLYSPSSKYPGTLLAKQYSAVIKIFFTLQYSDDYQTPHFEK